MRKLRGVGSVEWSEKNLLISTVNKFLCAFAWNCGLWSSLCRESIPRRCLGTCGCSSSSWMAFGAATPSVRGAKKKVSCRWSEKHHRKNMHTHIMGMTAYEAHAYENKIWRTRYSAVISRLKCTSVCQSFCRVDLLAYSWGEHASSSEWAGPTPIFGATQMKGTKSVRIPKFIEDQTLLKCKHVM